MRVRWNRVAVLLLFLLLVLIGLRFGVLIVPFLGSIVFVVDGHAPADQHLRGMMAFALVLLLVVAVLRLLLGSPPNRP